MPVDPGLAEAVEGRRALPRLRQVHAGDRPVLGAVADVLVQDQLVPADHHGDHGVAVVLLERLPRVRGLDVLGQDLDLPAQGSAGGPCAQGGGVAQRPHVRVHGMPQGRGIHGRQAGLAVVRQACLGDELRGPHHGRDVRGRDVGDPLTGVEHHLAGLVVHGVHLCAGVHMDAVPRHGLGQSGVDGLPVQDPAVRGHQADVHVRQDPRALPRRAGQEQRLEHGAAARGGLSRHIRHHTVPRGHTRQQRPGGVHVLGHVRTRRPSGGVGLTQPVDRTPPRGQPRAEHEVAEAHGQPGARHRGPFLGVHGHDVVRDPFDPVRDDGPHRPFEPGHVRLPARRVVQHRPVAVQLLAVGDGDPTLPLPPQCGGQGHAGVAAADDQDVVLLGHVVLRGVTGSRKRYGRPRRRAPRQTGRAAHPPLVAGAGASP